jgi:DNA-binding CsgD family transcriptional regulator
MKLEKNPTVDDFAAVIRKIVDSYGLRNAIYWCPTFRGRAVDDPFLVMTYEQEWKAHYLRSNYAAVDPVVNTGARSLLPVDWAKLDRSNRKVVKMFNEAREAGVGAQGLTIPIRGGENGAWGLFSVTSNESDAEWASRRREIVSDLVLVGYFMHQKAYELHTSGEFIDLNAITRRETEALAWTGEGKSVADIATLMSISTETVKAHLDSARFKLGALNRVHAVAKAIRHGIIG